MVDGAHGRAQPHAVAETLGHGDREALVAGGEPVAGVGLERGGVLEHAGAEPVALEGRRDLDPGDDRLARRFGQVERRDQPAPPSCRRSWPAARAIARPAACRVAVSVGDAAGLADVVAHAGVGELEAVAVREVLASRS